MFRIINKDPHSRARTGLLETPHGVIETPAYSIVGTYASIRHLPPELIPATKTQLIIANTYHLWERAEEIAQTGGLAKVMGWPGPTMTDSGGFQVFSLGFSREHGIGKVIQLRSDHSPETIANNQNKPERNLVRITDEGAWFSQPEPSSAKEASEGETKFLGPELSIALQEKIGADIIMSFDECTSPLHDYGYTKTALERTQRWAKICLASQTRSDQLLYGIVQGGEFQDLREASAKYINSLPFPGFAIGGSFSKSADGDFNVLNWTIPHLDETRPRHFLGVGKIEDLFDGVLAGIDTFDCVIPTREARHGGIWTKHGRYDIHKAIHSQSKVPLEEGCACDACISVDRATVHALFKAKDTLAGQYAIIHNIFFFNNLMAQIRQAIKEQHLREFRNEFLANSKKPR